MPDFAPRNRFSAFNILICHRCAPHVPQLPRAWAGRSRCRTWRQGTAPRRGRSCRSWWVRRGTQSSGSWLEPKEGGGRHEMKYIVVPFKTFVKLSRTPCRFKLHQSKLQLQKWIFCLSRSTFLREKISYQIYTTTKIGEVFVFICTGCLRVDLVNKIPVSRHLAMLNYSSSLRTKDFPLIPKNN